VAALKKIVLAIWLSILFVGIAYLFWRNEYIYSLPTPVPRDYQEVKIGALVDLPIENFGSRKKPMFLHFFNPACPCSRFNIAHVKSLFKKYERQMSFAIVVINSEKEYSEEEIQDKFDFKVPVFFDQSIASACGVYSTPQAAILTGNHTLYYRGNYNKSRYCTNKESNYAQNAIDSLLSQVQTPQFSPLALTAYGCVLPSCEKPKEYK